MKLSIRFSLLKNRSKDNPIRMRISYDGIRLDINTGFVCPEESWIQSTMRMRNGTVNRHGEKASLINSKLSEYESFITNTLTRYDLDGVTPEPSVLKNDFDIHIGRKSKSLEKEDSISIILDRYIEEKGKDWRPSTLRIYTSMADHIRTSKIGSKSLSSVTREDIISIPSIFTSKGMLNTSSSRYYNSFLTFLHWCQRVDMYNGKIDKIKMRGSNARKNLYYLEWDEVLRIMDIELERVDSVVRDTFCFECFTGLRVTDVTNLKWSSIHLNDKVPYLQLTTQKTSDEVKIELNDLAISILQRYIDLKTEDGNVFPKLSLTCKNNRLPYIAKSAGIEGSIHKTSFIGNIRKEDTIQRADAITTHWARHTFIVHALSIGISPVVVMSWTGHNNYEAMRPYISIVDSVKAESMKKFND